MVLQGCFLAPLALVDEDNVAGGESFEMLDGEVALCVEDAAGSLDVAQTANDAAKATSANGRHISEYHLNGLPFVRYTYERSRDARDCHYAEKEDHLEIAVGLAEKCGIRCYWQRDDNDGPESDPHGDVLYFDLPTGQVSFHAERHGAPLYETTEKITDYYIMRGNPDNPATLECLGWDAERESPLHMIPCARLKYPNKVAYFQTAEAARECMVKHPRRTMGSEVRARTRSASPWDGIVGASRQRITDSCRNYLKQLACGIGS